MIDSFRKNRVGIILMLISAICACLGQLLWKIGAEQGIAYVFIGFFLYGLGALVMIVAYRYGKLSILQPILSCNYILSMFLGYFVLQEQISVYKILGVVIIILGVIFIAGGDEE